MLFAGVYPNEVKHYLCTMKWLIVFFSVVLASVGNLQAQEPLYAAAPTKDFLLGKTRFQNDTNFIKIPQEYTTLQEPNNYIQKQTYRAFLKMREAALADGIVLTVTSASRNFWIQRIIWEEKWMKSKVAAGAARAKDILKYNSMCGTSRHHWGTELDFNTPKFKFWDSPKGKATYKWLCENAHKYGFYQPYSAKSNAPGGRATGYNEEVWHWSYYPLANIYMQQYKWKIKEKDLGGFAGSEHVPGLKIIQNYVFGVAAPPEA